VTYVTDRIAGALRPHILWRHNSVITLEHFWVECGSALTESKVVNTLRRRYLGTLEVKWREMPAGFELLWFLCVVLPLVVLTVRTAAARRKASEREHAWKIGEPYILCCASPEPQSSSVLTLESDVQAIAA
jgi:hypothetical protein